MKSRQSFSWIPAALYSITAIILCSVHVSALDAEVAETDICSLPKESGSCKDKLKRFYFDKELGKCEEFVYGGCQGNANNFETFNECDGLCGECTLPKHQGPCEKHITRNFFNKNTGVCQKFIYGSCGGNSNNFESLKECEDRCRGVLCYLPKDPGPCDADIPSFFYNSKTKACEKFTFGGCDGNANNFQTVEKCKERCVVTGDEAEKK